MVHIRVAQNSSRCAPIILSAKNHCPLIGVPRNAITLLTTRDMIFSNYHRAYTELCVPVARNREHRAFEGLCFLNIRYAYFVSFIQS